MRWAVFAGIALAALVCAGALLDWRSLTQASRPLTVAAGLIACLWIARLALLVEPASGWTAWPDFTAVTYASPTLPRLLASPFDFVATALCATGTVLALVHWSETIGLRRRRRRGMRPRSWLTVALRAAAAGVAVAAGLELYVAFLQDTVAHATVDLIHLSLTPFNGPRLLLQLGLVVADTGLVAALVLVLRASAWWRRRAWGRMGLALRALSADEKRMSGLESGLVVEGVSGPAARAGVQPGDLLLAIDGQPVNNLAQAGAASTGAGKSVAVLLQRGDAKIYVPLRLS